MRKTTHLITEFKLTKIIKWGTNSMNLLLNLEFSVRIGAEYSLNFPLEATFDRSSGFKATENYKFKYGNWDFISRFLLGEGA